MSYIAVIDFISDKWSKTFDKNLLWICRIEFFYNLLFKDTFSQQEITFIIDHAIGQIAGVRACTLFNIIHKLIGHSSLLNYNF